MGISKEWGRETTEEHYGKSSFPMQSGITWLWSGDEKIKRYFHNIGSVTDKKNASYTGFELIICLKLS